MLPLREYSHERKNQKMVGVVHVQSGWAGLPQLGVLVSIWVGHSPFEALA